jgi:hypothetical protein
VNTEIGVVILSGVLPLLGVLIGSGSTILVQRSSARESRIRAEAERRGAQRTEVKSAIESYLKVAQHLQSQLWSREHGGEVLDIPPIVEQVWLAHAHVDIICSERLRVPLTEHALALHDVARHEEQYPDYWEHVLPHKLALHDAIRKELSLQDDGAFVEPRMSSLRDRALSERNYGAAKAQSGTREPGLEQPQPGSDQARPPVATLLSVPPSWPRASTLVRARADADGRLRGAGVAPVGFAARGVGGHLRPDEQESCLFMRDGAVLGAARDDEQVAGSEIDVAISHLNGDAALDDEKYLVLVIMAVPVRRTDSLGDLEQVAVGAREYLLAPELGQLSGFTGKVYLLHDTDPAWGQKPPTVLEIPHVARFLPQPAAGRPDRR